VELTPMMRKAIMFAVKAHVGQLDASGIPYIAHPFRVALAGIEFGETDFCGGMLHDVVEDCGITLDELETEFNREIRDTVDSVTRRISPDGTKELYSEFRVRSRAHPFGCRVAKRDLLDNSSPERLLSLPESERGVEKRYKKALLLFEDVGI
jgi:hypothetical protein